MKIISNSNKTSWVLLLCALGLATYFVSKVWVRMGDAVVAVVVLQQPDTIMSIDSPRQAGASREFIIDQVNFPPGNTLRHAKLGPLGFSQNFFVDLETTMTVEQPGKYEFKVASDDGFRLKVNDKVVAEFAVDRDYAASTGSVYLTQGGHRIQISYFQRYGPLGLSAEYRKEGGEFAFVGQASSGISFSADTTK